MLIGEQIITYRRGLKSQNHINTNTTKKASFIQFSTHATTNNPTPHSNDQPQKPAQDEKAPIKEQDDQKQDLDKKEPVSK